MADPKLSQLPGHNPVKLSIPIMPNLHQALTEYAALYARTYEETVAELIPAMFAAFLDTDRSFVRSGARA